MYCKFAKKNSGISIDYLTQNFLSIRYGSNLEIKPCNFFKEINTVFFVSPAQIRVGHMP